MFFKALTYINIIFCFCYGVSLTLFPNTVMRYILYKKGLWDEYLNTLKNSQEIADKYNMPSLTSIPSSFILGVGLLFSTCGMFSLLPLLHSECKDDYAIMSVVLWALLNILHYMILLVFKGYSQLAAILNTVIIAGMLVTWIVYLCI